MIGPTEAFIDSCECLFLYFLGNSVEITVRRGLCLENIVHYNGKNNEFGNESG